MTVSVPRIEKLLAEATERGGGSAIVVELSEHLAQPCIASCEEDELEDAALICEAVDALPALIAAVKALDDLVNAIGLPGASTFLSTLKAREALAPFSFEEQA